ncbi:hypothetical protein TNCT_659571 [Trichonephila clavata]|uniref:Uncharacterized protein n=1 Tax=Trichonephila clavata TaxID=2740835 RepID=A0A8X6KUN3_TRICU|nr:hypothetical protein TNCT_659571 [Trichonephila clavata]
MELNLDHYLDSGMKMNLEQPLTPGNDMDITLLCSDTTSQPGTPQPSGCQRRRLATEILKYYAITIDNIKSNINALQINGLTDESSYIWKENLARLADYIHLQEITAIPFSLPHSFIYFLYSHLRGDSLSFTIQQQSSLSTNRTDLLNYHDRQPWL